jgi:arabinose-5-phosphate isomerase
MNNIKNISKHIINLEADELKKLVNSFDDKYEEAINKICSCVGNLLFFGTGKSGNVAQKVASTISGLGMQSLFLDPSRTLHGELGFVKEGDLSIFFSKRGKTAELFDLIPHLKKRNVQIVLITANLDSKIAKKVDYLISLYSDREIDKENLIPTISSTRMMVIGDIITTILMESKKTPLSNYKENHPY